MLSRCYSEAFRMCVSCITDAPLASDELQLWQRLGPVSRDLAPDAVATRLRLSLLTTAVTGIMSAKWNVAHDARLYFDMRDCVTATCRLTPRDELEVIESLSELACTSVQTKTKSEKSCWLLLNRRDFLRLALRPDAPRDPAPASNASMWKVSLRYPQYRPGSLAPDMSMRIVGLDAKSFLTNFATLSYSRPDEASNRETSTTRT